MPKPRTSLDFSISENHNGGIHSARSPGETLNMRCSVERHVQKLVLVLYGHCGPSPVNLTSFCLVSCEDKTVKVVGVCP